MLVQDIDQAKRLAERLWPELAEQPSELPKQGAQGFVILYPDKVVKFPRGTWNVRSLEIEAEMLSRLEGFDTGGVCVPQLMEYDSSNNALVISRLPGVTLDKNVMLAMGAAQRCKLGAELGILLARIHNSSFDLGDEKCMRSADDIHDALFALHDGQLQERANICASDVSAIRNFLESFYQIDEPFCSLHGDVSIGNLLYCDRTQRLSLIDFSGSYMGYRHREFLRTGNFHPEIQVSCMNAYNGLSPIKITDEMLDVSRKAESVMRVLNLNGGLEMHFSP